VESFESFHLDQWIKSHEEFSLGYFVALDEKRGPWRAFLEPFPGRSQPYSPDSERMAHLTQKKFEKIK